MTYAIASDLHAHSWSVYATTDSNGVNSRLRIILDELERTAAGLLLTGGTTMVIAGDIFHTRGQLDPEVLNPVQTTFRNIMDLGIEILMIPGNHDLKGKETTELGSAIQTLSETFSAEGSIRVFNKPQLVFGDQPLAFIPWCSTNDQLLREAEALARLAGPDLKDFDLIIHAGIDGVLANMPDHGLTPGRLANIGFRNVFAGHYHNHKDLGGNIYSIGATTHQTWSDVDTKAGFLFVGDKVLYQASHAPSFIDVTGMSEEDMMVSADGNYVRFRGGTMQDSEIKELREFFKDSGALGISIQVTKQAATARASTAKAGTTLEDSVSGYVDASKDIPAHVDRDRVKRECADVLSSVRSIHEEA